MKNDTINKLLVSCIAFVVWAGISHGQIVESNNMPAQKRQIGGVINSQGIVLRSDIRERLLRELERPFAVGGKLHLLDSSQSDINAGWELFLDEGAIRAVVEFSVNDPRTGVPQMIIATVDARLGTGKCDKLVIEVTPILGGVRLEDGNAVDLLPGPK